MADIATKYYVKRGSQQFATISSLFGGVRILKVGGMTDVGSAKNIYTESWVNSQTEDCIVAGDNVVRENVDIDITFIVSNKYGAINVREQHDAFVAYMTDGEMYIKSDYIGRTFRCVSLKDYKPTTIHIKREGGNNDYIIGTITMHTLDNRAGDDDGYIVNPYPSSGGDTPTPIPTQVSATNVYDAALGATQASLNQLFFEKPDGSNFYTKAQVNDLISRKQDIINDLAEIRSGARKGATAIQQHQDISGKADKSDTYTKNQVNTIVQSKYSKPVTGIPMSDLSSEVQTLIEEASQSKTVRDILRGGNVSLKPNTLYVDDDDGHGKASTIISLSATTQSNVDEYMIRVCIKTEGRRVTFPQSIKWTDGVQPDFELNVTYDISIVDNLAVYTEWE